MKRFESLFPDVYIVQMDDKPIKALKGSADALLDCMQKYIDIYTVIVHSDYKLPQFNDNEGQEFIDYINAVHPLGLSIHTVPLWEEIDK